jgi:hypothetical protein
MANVTRDHRYYRELAEEARKKAEAAKDRPTLRQSYLDVATSYDKLADTLERRFMDRESDS